MKQRTVCVLVGLAFALLQLSCSDEKAVTYELKTLPKEVFVHETFALEVSPATSGWTFSSKNSNIASVSDSGVVTTHYVGKTMLYVRHAVGGFVDSVQVTVKPQTTFYDEPYRTFPAVKLAVEGSEPLEIYAYGRYGNGCTCNLHRGECGIGFAYELKYYFNEYGDYTYSSICFNTMFADDVMKQVTERYMLVSEKNNGEEHYRYFISPDSSLLVSQYSVGNELWLFYLPYSAQALETFQKDVFGKVFEL